MTAVSQRPQRKFFKKPLSELNYLGDISPEPNNRLLLARESAFELKWTGHRAHKFRLLNESVRNGQTSG